MGPQKAATPQLIYTIPKVQMTAAGVPYMPTIFHERHNNKKKPWMVGYTQSHRSKFPSDDYRLDAALWSEK